MTLTLIILILTLIGLVMYIVNRWNSSIWSVDGNRSIAGKIRLCISAPIGWFFIGITALVFITVIVGRFPDVKRVPNYSIGIVAMKDRFATEGSFFLGCGTVENKSYYYYYGKSHAGGYKQERIETTCATIFEDDTKVPRIQYYKYEFVNPVWSKWGIPPQYDQIDIFVPVGSIVKNYTFDLK